MQLLRHTENQGFFLTLAAAKVLRETTFDIMTSDLV